MSVSLCADVSVCGDGRGGARGESLFGRGCLLLVAGGVLEDWVEGLNGTGSPPAGRAPLVLGILRAWVVSWVVQAVDDRAAMSRALLAAAYDVITRRRCHVT